MEVKLVNKQIKVTIDKYIVLWNYFQQICVDKTLLVGSRGYQPSRKDNFRSRRISVRIWKICLFQNDLNIIAVSFMRIRSKNIHIWKIWIQREQQ